MEWVQGMGETTEARMWRKRAGGPEEGGRCSKWAGSGEGMEEMVAC